MAPRQSNKKLVSGFVSILGRPSSGKSTLLNALLGTKLAIVTDKPQTTRTSIQGVLNLPGAQIVFLDTPGVHKPRGLLNKRMMETVRAALPDRDLLLWVADCLLPFTDADKGALELLAPLATPVFLVLNKIDRLKDKRALLPLIESYRTSMRVAECFPVSALKGPGLEELRAAILAAMPEGPQYFPPDHLTDQPERFLAAELIREKVLLATRQEVPHSVAVLVDQWEESPKLVRILATVFVERDGQKRIVIGSQGQMIKRIGTNARLELEGLLGRRIYLELFVKVRPDWRESREFLDEIDWRMMTGGESW